MNKISRKKIMGKILLIFLGCLLMQQTQARIDETDSLKKDTLYLDFNQTVELLNSQNHYITAARLETEEMKYKKKAAQGLYFPRIGLSGAYTLMSEDLAMDLSPVGTALEGLYNATLLNTKANPGIPLAQKQAVLTKLDGGLKAVQNGHWNIMLQEKQFGLVDANIMWPIFTGGKIMAANKAASAMVKESEQKLNQVTGKQMTELVQRYFGLQLAIQVSKVRKEAVDAMQKHLSDARKLQENGMAPMAEQLHAEVAFADADRQYKKSLQDAKLLEIALQSSISTEFPIQPKTPLFINENVQGLSYYKEQAKGYSPIVKRLEAKEELAIQGVRKEKSAYYPNVVLMGKKDLVNKDLSEHMPEWFVGVGVKMTLFDGLSRERKIKSAKIVHERVRTYQEKAKQDINTLVTKIYQQMDQAKEQYESINASVKFAEEYLRIKNKAFQQGFTNSSEVTDAQLYLIKVKTEQLKAMYDYDVALAQLLEITGESAQYPTYF